MITVSGKSISGGIQFGRLVFYQNTVDYDKETNTICVKAELERLESVCQEVKHRLQDMYEQVAKVSKDEANVFLSHQMLLEDAEYMDAIRCMIAEKEIKAEQAVKLREQELEQFFASMDDVRLKERIADIKDVTNQLIETLCVEKKDRLEATYPAIVVAKDLLPSQIVRMQGKEIGVILTEGSPYSHTAILAKSVGIPMMIGALESVPEDSEGKMAILDGYKGVLYIEPNEETASRIKQNESVKKEQNLTDTCRIKICANITDSCEIEAVLQNNADGVGLFRSEALYLKGDSFPTEEEQFEIYKSVLEGMKGKKVVVRTLDVGGDKQTEYLQLPKETNPALGLRGIRYSFYKKEIFQTQIRALLRAGIYGNLAILFPMIISVEEVKQIKGMIEEVKKELRIQQVEFCVNPQLGIMIETPAAVLMSRELAKEVDFFSVGTNDLTQYTLAVDRQNPIVESSYNPHHPAILRMIHMATESIRAEGKWIAICGELGADESMLETFLEIGVDELSVPIGDIHMLKKKVQEIQSHR